MCWCIGVSPRARWLFPRVRTAVRIGKVVYGMSIVAVQDFYRFTKWLSLRANLIDGSRVCLRWKRQLVRLKMDSMATVEVEIERFRLIIKWDMVYVELLRK